MGSGSLHSTRLLISKTPNRCAVFIATGALGILILPIPIAQLRMRGLQSRHTQVDLVLISWKVDNLVDLCMGGIFKNYDRPPSLLGCLYPGMDCISFPTSIPHHDNGCMLGHHYSSCLPLSPRWTPSIHSMERRNDFYSGQRSRRSSSRHYLSVGSAMW